MSKAIYHQGSLVKLTPADGFVKVEGIRIKEGKRATKTDTKESTKETQAETKRRKFSSL